VSAAQELQLNFVVMISRKNPPTRSVNQTLRCLVLLAWLLQCALVSTQVARASADSILVFNEIHYNPADGSAVIDSPLFREE
jgi:hypothetical protein